MKKYIFQNKYYLHISLYTESGIRPSIVNWIMSLWGTESTSLFAHKRSWLVSVESERRGGNQL